MRRFTAAMLVLGTANLVLGIVTNHRPGSEVAGMLQALLGLLLILRGLREWSEEQP